MRRRGQILLIARSDDTMEPRANYPTTLITVGITKRYQGVGFRESVSTFAQSRVTVRHLRAPLFRNYESYTVVVVK